ncbi:hypothetical protein V1520DRAFT_25973 [Lipomyces starkeyi]|uniref:MICOS complex subunit MIC12 n=1 Tax=Lipomyces starkeyi NRRL Y-11557 TaxID=675824 RepID=A0A1E3QBM0_LIPST|nr:hypothetical protein LIPSTDRAFT_1654 [Lipomyces starkeyi NRRL Y-11557]
MSQVFGFLAGVTTSSTLIYLLTSEIQRTATRAHTSIVQTRTTLESIVTPHTYTIIKPIPVETRGNVAETMKDLWDEEVVKGASFVLNADLGKWSRETAGTVWQKVTAAVSTK